MKAKRIEYQKFLRTKLAQEGYRELFGLSENIELDGEEDVVLQREFRIDFVFHKIDPTRPLEESFLPDLKWILLNHSLDTLKITKCHYLLPWCPQTQITRPNRSG